MNEKGGYDLKDRLACTSCNLFRGLAGNRCVFCGVSHGVEEGPRAVITREQVPIEQQCDDYNPSTTVLPLRVPTQLAA